MTDCIIKTDRMMQTELTHTSTAVVGTDNTARTLGSGDMDVFATPAMVALMENAAMNAVAGSLPEGSTTVGAKIDTTHLKPSKVGASVRATATLVEIDGRKLVFDVKAEDDGGLIGEGRHVRYVVDRQRFMAKLQ